ncbi:hypothetical protein [Rhodococcus sp. NPDC049939]|uniref:hypothetical protein n=1 Tax=Rhodococcus sp. NPDC049939 TaxID=3155511 RepID=UPI0033FCC9FA
MDSSTGNTNIAVAGLLAAAWPSSPRRRRPRKNAGASELELDGASAVGVSKEKEWAAHEKKMSTASARNALAPRCRKIATVNYS